MAITATVSQGQHLTPKVAGQEKILVTNYQLDYTNIRLSDMTDVAANNALDGSLLVYNGLSQIWEATPNIDNANTIINGGNF